MLVKRRTRTARRLRRDRTEAEKWLWWALRDAFPGTRFRRQHPVGRFIVDLACPSCKLAIELDGGQHAIQIGEDQQRTEELARRGYRVIRFWNNEVFENLPGVLQVIAAELAGPRAGSSSMVSTRAAEAKSE